ncbi:unnamed protein product [Arabis nemorensis]|uniref:Uncharacterized protein n=1 Tax=Arabis nemorensis TaxID=586526 RepID=A0A565CDG0_9BRAS|nr:unnamed protein product [Arabis nemorensis]
MPGDTAVKAMETTEPVGNNQNSGKSNSKDAESTDIEFKILAAMRSRVTDLRDKADSFTFVSVRRLLEEDMGLDKYALDVHKGFVKEHLVKCLVDAGNDGDSENSQETETKNMKDEGNKEALMNDIRKALRKRASYIKANSEKITMALLRRLLEQDLKLEKHSLDSYLLKKFINKELDEVSTLN